MNTQTRFNRIKVKIKPNGTVGLTLERRVPNGRWVPGTWRAGSRIIERISFTMPVKEFEKALAEATIEAPWAELLKTMGRR